MPALQAELTLTVNNGLEPKGHTVDLPLLYSESVYSMNNGPILLALGSHICHSLDCCCIQ